MKTLRIKNGDASDAYLKQMFNWLTRIGAAPKFGSRPISWYQIHQMNILNWLEKSKASGLYVRCNHGMVQARAEQGQWFDIATVRQLWAVGEQGILSDAISNS